MMVNAIAHHSIIYTALALFFGYLIYLCSFATYRLFKIGHPHLKITAEGLFHEGIWKKSEYVKFIDIETSDLKIHSVYGNTMCDLQLNAWNVQKQQKTGYGDYKEVLRIRIFPECYRFIDLDFATWITLFKRMNIQQRNELIQQWNLGIKPELTQYFTEKERQYYLENNVILIGNNIRLAFQHDAEQRQNKI
ncbi:hypothetical protein [Acinetobacter piscicola]|uniref:hypothetical protein n=1 Tax=Acinetobacter piscicola TaxID=2006115 RepID=UPI001020D442|nr:hypothetical protein [Acinetobacter piscicola]RYL28477.1 hypothetical protein EWP19_03850 [Acinetobacter piscicola]